MMSGFFAGQRLVIGKAERSAMEMLLETEWRDTAARPACAAHECQPALQSRQSA